MFLQHLFDRLLGGAPKLARLPHQSGSFSPVPVRGLGHEQSQPTGFANGAATRKAGLLDIDLPRSARGPKGHDADFSKRPAHPWRDQLYRLGAAMRDMSPRGGGHLEAADQRLEQRGRQSEADEQRARLLAFIEQAGMDPMQRSLFLADPDTWWRLYGAGFAQRTGAASPPPYGPEV